MSAEGNTVLVVDDERQIVRALRVLLRDAGFETVAAGGVEEALDLAALHGPDAAIVDLMLPDGTGVDVCRGLREWSSLPILVLSAVDEEDQKVEALQAGADDYVTKPFGPRELLARLQALLRRAAPAGEEPVIRVGDLDVDVAGHRVSRDGEEIHLTKIEFGLLRTLVRHRGKLLTHQALLLEVWGAAYAEDTATLRTHIANLRRKIEPPDGSGAPRLIRTETGVGYRLVA
ncbi:DNA-binding response regulator KdpE [Patulibacter medicamentivorans]|uniref:DNA-binding response regulator KdpE n=1 Tax=Patulibacter medicamentivorans TaxID=1097667 RepID=H0E433_9ACTN|nr:response regulator transcription factor [Patulibacter medicamentivorans]EHN11568.1 DNA-binding response regulator KdpE [Patulibacter medicamentivorans]